MYVQVSGMSIRFVLFLFLIQVSASQPTQIPQRVTPIHQNNQLVSNCSPKRLYHKRRCEVIAGRTVLVMNYGWNSPVSFKQKRRN